MPFMERGTFKLYFEDSGKNLSAILFLPGAGHSVYFEQPDLFNREVLHFLRKHKPV